MSTNAEAFPVTVETLCKVQQALPSRRVAGGLGTSLTAAGWRGQGTLWAEAGGRSGVPADLCASAGRKADRDPRRLAPHALSSFRPSQLSPLGPEALPDHQAQGPAILQPSQASGHILARQGAREGGVPTASRPQY